MNEKPAIKSKTIVSNSLVLAIMPILNAFGVPVNAELLLALIPLANILLRLVTKDRVVS